MAERMKNCRGCGKLFLSRGSNLCTECIEKQAEVERQIVGYVREHPDCAISEIVAALSINERVVRRLIEEGRLVQAGIEYHYPCVKCGAPISAGQYCNECARKFRAEIKAEQAKRNARDGIGMRYKNFAGNLNKL